MNSGKAWINILIEEMRELNQNPEILLTKNWSEKSPIYYENFEL